MIPRGQGLIALGRALRRGEVSAEALLERSLARRAAQQPRLNAFITLDAEGALAEARRVDRRLAAGEDPGPLAGIPLAVKDNLVSAELPTTCGSAMLAGWQGSYQATAVARLRRAGAVLLGKTNLDEFAMGSSGETSAAGPCKNPWHPGRVPGGSSSGSAAAVAAGICPLALGSDTGGSVRQPAAFCGVSGLRPTRGRVSRFGLVAHASSLDTVGPLARRVEDLALGLDLLAGPDGRDSTCLPRPARPFARACAEAPTGLRLGIPEALWAELPGVTAAALEQCRQQLCGAGLSCQTVTLPPLDPALAAYDLLAAAEASSNLARFDGLRYGHRTPEGGGLDEVVRRSRSEGFGAEVRRRLLLGTLVLGGGQRLPEALAAGVGAEPASLYHRAVAQRQRWQQILARTLAACDLLLLPTTRDEAFAFQKPEELRRADLYTAPAALADLPALSLPCGAGPGGLPLGLQLVAAAGAEPRLFCAGAAFQRVTDWHLRRPPAGGEAGR